MCVPSGGRGLCGDASGGGVQGGVGNANVVGLK